MCVSDIIFIEAFKRLHNVIVLYFIYEHSANASVSKQQDNNTTMADKTEERPQKSIRVFINNVDNYTTKHIAKVSYFYCIT